MLRVSSYITQTGTWPVTLAIAKNYLRVDHSADDDFIELLINEAGKSGQGHANAQFNSAISGVIIAKQYDNQERYTREEMTEIDLFYPNSSIIITEVKVGGTALTGDDYEVLPGNVLKLNSQPAANERVEVSYTASVDTAVDLSLGVLKLVADAYENRTEQSIEPLTRVRMNAAKYFQEKVSGADMF